MFWTQLRYACGIKDVERRIRAAYSCRPPHESNGPHAIYPRLLRKVKRMSRGRMINLRWELCEVTMRDEYI